VLAVLHPSNRRSLEELWRQIKDVNNLVQRHDTMFLEVDHDIRRLLPVLPAVRDHAQDILTLWVHIRDAMFIIDPEWTKRCSVPSYPTKPVKYLSSVPVTLPKGFDLIVASPDTLIPYQSYYFAPIVTQLLPGPRVRTPPVTPSRAAGGGEAPESSKSPNQFFSLTAGHPTGHMLFSDLGTAQAHEAAVVEETAEEEGPSQPACNDWATRSQLPAQDRIKEIEAKIMADYVAHVEATRAKAEADYIARLAKLDSTPTDTQEAQPQGGQEEHAAFHGPASFHGEDFEDEEGIIHQANNPQELEGQDDDDYCEDFGDEGEFGPRPDENADDAPEGLIPQTPVTPVTQVSLSSAFSTFEARLAGVASDPAHHQPDPMDIELANTIASAKKQYTPAKIPNPRSTSSEPAAGPSGSSEPFLPGPPAGAEELPKAPRKGKTATSSTDVPPRAPTRVSTRQASRTYASMNESDMQKANARVVGTIGQIRDEMYEALLDFDLRQEEEARQPLVRCHSHSSLYRTDP
jgi:hypothetical protein